MNTNEKNPVTADLMTGLSENVGNLKNVIPALCIALILICSRYMESQMEAIHTQFKEEVLPKAEESPELVEYRQQKEAYEKALANLKDVDIHADLPKILLLIKAAPAVMEKATRFLDAHSAEIIRILEEAAE